MRQVKNSFLGHGVYYAAINHTTPINLTYAWNFGSLAVLCLVFQIITGVSLAMHYTPDVDLAFSSVEHIMRDVRGGWLIRYMHSNGASMFFIVVYAHIVRGLYYTSYVWPRQVAWALGVVLFLLMIVTAFLGYVLPWGQMSFWGATVITNLVGAVPVIGGDILTWLWGGFSIGNAALTRFFALHFTIPFVIAGVAAVHIILVQHFSSNNPLGVHFMMDSIPFTPYYLAKDVWGFVLFGFFYSFFVFFAPNLLGHPDNYILANPLVTPAHIVPEWYFLPFYAILRAVPDKFAGVVAMGAGILVLFVLPYVSGANLRSMQFRPISKFVFWLFVGNFFYLGVLGGLPAKAALNETLVTAVVSYFGYFLVLQPVIDRIENFLGAHDRPVA